jgi:hypothetical protein
MSKKPDSAVSKKRGPARSSRRKAAEAAGLSRGQMWRALQVAEIPEEDFEALVEADAPPSVAELVRVGSGRTREPQGRRLKCCPHCGGDLTLNDSRDD